MAAQFLFLDSNIPGMGAGYRARVYIPRGTLLFQEAPIILLAQEIPDQDRDERIEDAVRRLPPVQFQQFEQLQTANQFINHRPAAGKFLTNALRCEVNNAHLAGLFLMGSRFNSSCTPNVHQHWNGNFMQFRAMTDIQPNQELCICYNIRKLTLPRAERRVEIEGAGGYECRCSACLHPNHGSDARRASIGEALAIHDPNDLERVLQNFNIIHRAIQALQQEGIHHYRDTLLYDGYLVCLTAGDINNAVLWLERAYEAAVLVVGIEDPQAQRVRMDRLRIQTQPARAGWMKLLPPPI